MPHICIQNKENTIKHLNFNNTLNTIGKDRLEDAGKRVVRLYRDIIDGVFNRFVQNSISPPPRSLAEENTLILSESASSSILSGCL